MGRVRKSKTLNFKVDYSLIARGKFTEMDIHRNGFSPLKLTNIANIKPLITYICKNNDASR